MIDGEGGFGVCIVFVMPLAYSMVGNIIPEEGSYNFEIDMKNMACLPLD